ncbi:hypothetical protein Aperf_G00000026853 [Anoplocephala perfoliata]
MTQFYHTAAQRSTAVTKALRANFTGPNDLNLLIVKNTYLEFYDVTSEGLKVIRDVPVNGSVVTALFFRRRNRKQDSLCIVTLRANVIIIECNRTNDSIEFETIYSTNVAANGHLMMDQGFDAIVDPTSSYIAIRLFQGLLKIISVGLLPDRQGSKVNESICSDVKLDEPGIIDMVFLHGYENPTFAVIYEEEMAANLKMLELNMKEHTLTPLPTNANSIENTSRMLIPVPAPHGGFMIVGDSMVFYHCPDHPHISELIPQKRNTRMVSYSAVDIKRYLMGNLSGELFMIHLLGADELGGSSSLTNVTNIRIEPLGETSIPESIAYLDKGVVFVGSFFGDSQLIHLRSEIDPERKCYFDVFEEYTNVGPIADMVFVENEGQNQLITCSGFFRDGSLRIIRSGIGIQETATIDQADINGVWCFACKSESYDDAIVCSMRGRSRIVRLEGDELEMLKLEGFAKNERTLLCATVYTQGHKETVRSLLLQATSTTLRLIGIQDLFDKGCLATWSPPTERSISSLTAHGDLVVVASGSDIFALRITGDQNAPVFTQIGQNSLSSEVACIDITPFSRSVGIGSSKNDSLAGDESSEILESSLLDDLEPEYAAVGLWMGHGISLLKLPSLEEVSNDPLPTEIHSTGAVILPRSVAIAQFDDLIYVFAVSGDGTLFYYNVDCSNDTVALRDRKQMNIGSTCQVRLVQWHSHGKRYIFLCSNRPCIIYSNRHKLVFANVNIKEVSFMAPLNVGPHVDSSYGGWPTIVSGSRICMVTPRGVVIGSVDSLQKLHVRKIPLYETPRRIILQEETYSIGLITLHTESVLDNGAFTALRPSISSDRTAKIGQTNCSIHKSSYIKKKFNHVEVSSLLIFCQTTLQLRYIYRFGYNQECYEMAMTMCSSELGLEYGALYIVGTAFVELGDEEPKKGRIHVLRWDPRTEELHQIGIHDVLGCLHQICDFNGRLVAAVSSSVRVYSYVGGNFQQDSSYNENITALYVCTNNDYVLVGDIMRSCSLLLFKPGTSTLEMIARHNCPRYTSAIDVFDDDHFISADMEGNIQLMGRNQHVTLEEPVVPTIHTVTQSFPKPSKATSSKAPTSSGSTTPIASTSVTDTPASGSEDSADTLRPTELTAACLPLDQKCLVDYAYINTGESVNIFAKGNMNTLCAEHWDSIGKRHTLYGSSHGCLGMLVNISPILFVFLKQVEAKLKSLIEPFGGLSHEAFRACRDCLSTYRAPHNIIDGELVETFLELTTEDKLRVVKDLRIPLTVEAFGKFDLSSYDNMVPTKDCSIGDLTRVIEELAALH